MKLEKIKKLFTELGKYSIITIVVIAAFFLGKFYESFKNSSNNEDKVVITKIERSDVNIAIDENNHLIVIDKKTGDYVIYQDSIGNSIFKLYAKNIWAQHTESK
jgi:hypothetical protein